MNISKINKKKAMWTAILIAIGQITAIATFTLPFPAYSTTKCPEVIIWSRSEGSGAKMMLVFESYAQENPGCQVLARSDNSVKWVIRMVMVRGFWG